MEFDSTDVEERFEAICNALDIHFPKEYSWRRNPDQLSVKPYAEIVWFPDPGTGEYVQRLNKLDFIPADGFFDIADTLQRLVSKPPIAVEASLTGHYGLRVDVESEDACWGDLQDALEQVKAELLAMLVAEFEFQELQETQ